MRPPPQRNAVLAFVLGIGVAGTAAWWRAEQNLVVSDKNDPAPILGAPHLASISDFKLVGAAGPAPTISAPGSGAAEACEFALSSLGFALEEFSSSTVLITSTFPNEGKSATALNLSIAAAQDGRKVLLVDADERARGLTFLSGLLDSFGVSDLNRPVDVDRAIHQWDMADGSRLEFVPAGSGVVGIVLIVTEGTRSRDLEEARQVLQAGALAEGGDVLVLDMGESVKIVDLANRLAHYVNPGKRPHIVFTGLRTGEKLHEQVISDDDTALPCPHHRLSRYAVDTANRVNV